ncbi:CBS domain-containing protein [Thiorhodococcus minor]|uniref:CBS domain-containing protein n=1 Tax=Thiorhodococcus minor TaxID=57489 RepID=A0A6M0JYH5_9GAMM|nr:CBS domain-containing protein [Thiorhodococcus minor]NEV61155.1 CBS domain-containing protein [Thiorhodococcus minor]
MKKIQELLEGKGASVWSIGPDATVFDALTLMAEHRIGALLVVDDNGPVGLISERDYAREGILRGRASRDTPVRDIMTHRVVCATPEQSLEDAMILMTEKRVRHLPVIEDGQVLGLVSIGDLVKSIISEQKFIIEQLEHYINS